jgi:hypothetical protein
MRVRREVMRCERDEGGRHMAEGDRRRGRKMRYNGHIINGELTWRGTRHTADNEWMLRCKMDHMDGKRRG